MENLAPGGAKLLRPRGPQHTHTHPRAPGAPGRIFDFSPLDPLGGPGGLSGPTLERTIFYDFLKFFIISVFPS